MKTASATGGGIKLQRPKRTGRIFGAIVTIALLGGCAGLQPPRENAPTLYVLSAQPLHSAASPRREVVIEVAQPRAWPGFDTAQIAYVRQPYELDYFAASRWADTPARMLGPLVARALEQTGSFRAVVQMPSTVPADVRVDVEIIRLQQNFAVHPSRAELTLRVQLTEMRGKRVADSKVIEELESAPSEDAAGGVAAVNAALQRALEQLAEFCVAESAAR